MSGSLRSLARHSLDGMAEAGIAWAARKERDSYTSDLIRFILEARSEAHPPLVDRWMFPTLVPCPARPLKIFRMLSFLSKNSERLNRVAALLDQTSRHILARVLAYNALGPVHVTLPHTAEILSCYDDAQRMKTGGSLVNLPPFETSTFRTHFDGHDIEVECWLGNIVYTFLRRQYYLRRGAIDAAPRPGDVVIDAGACFGDTALAFAATVGPAGRVHSFEPMPRQVDILRSNIERNAALAPRIEVHPYALSRVSGQKLTFSDAGAGARATGDRGVEVETKKLDDLVGRQIERVDFIKMDIEGAELAAIEGAAETIRRFRPRLGISVYHSLNDYIDIPLALKEICPDYEFHLEHYTAHEFETVLYAVPR